MDNMSVLKQIISNKFILLLSHFMTGPDGSYRYIADLLSLKHATLTPAPYIDHRIATVQTPLNIPEWQTCLQSHPDTDFAAYILNGLQFGFHLGCRRPANLQSSKTNMQSARQNHLIIDDYLRCETEAGNILGPYPPHSFPNLHINRFGVIPKKHHPGRWRLITDLSFPEGSSVNDAIDPALCTLEYIKVDRVAESAMQLGNASLLAKIDIKSAYRLIPVHPMDRTMLGMQWNGQVYIDGMLPFGLRSAPKLFNAVADALEWCIAQKGVQHIVHYLDDFLVMGPPNSPDCQESLHILEALCSKLGVPLAPEKRDGPASILTFLGIIIDTTKGELRLPPDKLQRLLDAVTTWINKRACTRRELQSLIGTLQHACSVIKPGRSFLRRAIALLSVAKRQHHHIRLNADFRSDMMWWKIFATHWNGRAVIITKGPHEVTITSDASGTWGCGAWWKNRWFQLQWTEEMLGKHISVKELIPVIIATLIWGQHINGKRVLCNCDNSAVVTVLNTRYSKDKDLMQLLRCLFFIEAYYQFQLTARHLPGTLNDCADDLSRNRQAAFHSKLPHADIYPTPIPPSLMQWLLQPQTDWTSPTWIQQFATFVTRE